MGSQGLKTLLINCYLCIVVWHSLRGLVLLSIDAPLEADERPIDIQSAPQGSTVVMDCKTALMQPVTYQWSKQGGSLPHDTNTETVGVQYNREINK